MQERLVALAEEQQKVGTATTLDVEQLRTLLEQTRSTIPALQIALGQANDRLCILLGEPPHDLEPELGPGPELGGLPMPTTPASVAAGIPADLLRRRPDVRSAERQVAAQSAQIGVAEADLYPSISIGDHARPRRTSDLGPSVGVQRRPGVHHAPVLVEHPELRPPREQRPPPGCQDPGIDRDLPEPGPDGGPGSPDRAAGLPAVAGTGRRTWPAAPPRPWPPRRSRRSSSRDIKADVNRLFTLANTQLQAQDQLAVAQGNIALNLINVYRALGGGWEIRHQKDGCGEGVGPVAPVPGIRAPACSTPQSSGDVVGPVAPVPGPAGSAFGTDRLPPPRSVPQPR